MSHRTDPREPPSSTSATGPGGPGTAAARRRDPLAIASLVAVALVVALVSLPSLRGFALRQNENDALRLVRALAAAADAPEREPGDPPPRADELLRRAESLRHAFGDLEVLDGGAQLRCHGYLFDLVPGRPAPRTAGRGGAGRAADAGFTARAWPWSHARTGFAAFLCSSDGMLIGHRNADGRWSGPGSAPPLPGRPAAAGWRRMR